MSATDTRGYTRADSVPFGQRVRNNRFLIFVLATITVVVLIIGFTRSSENSNPLSTNNPGALGTRALAEVARAQGVTVREVDKLSSTRITDPANTTLVIADGSPLQSYQAGAIVDYPGDIVVFGDAGPLFEALDISLGSAWGNEGIITADCSDADAEAAQTVASTGMTIRGDLPANAIGCFAGVEDEWSYVSIDNGEHLLVVIPDTSVPVNGSIALEGHAALALRAIGHHPNVVWYVGSPFDPSTPTWSLPPDPNDPDPDNAGSGNPGSGEPGSGNPGSGNGNGNGENGEQPLQPGAENAPDFLPPGTGNFVYAVLLALLVVALWRARRFGALVTEPLPVVIRASEATRGRARLYRAAGAHGRAGVSLRAAAATRMGKKLGVSRYGSKEALVVALSRATQRPQAEIEDLLFGIPPQSESAMMDLAAELDKLEREVHGP